MKIILIAAISDNGVIGKGNTIPWKCKEDMNYFKETTIGKGNNAVLMGRKTWDSLGKYKPLPDRYNIVLTTDHKDLPIQRNVMFIGNKEYPQYAFEEGISTANGNGKDNLFIIGGASIYKQYWEKCDELLITRIHQMVDGDCYFPEVDWEKFVSNSFKRHDGYSLQRYIKRTHD